MGGHNEFIHGSKAAACQGLVGALRSMRRSMHHEGTKDTKGSEGSVSELRALHAFVVKNSFPFGCGCAALRLVPWREGFELRSQQLRLAMLL